MPLPEINYQSFSLVLRTCAGDRNGDGTVNVSELVTGVNIALGSATADKCLALDVNGDGEVAINELVAAVNTALNGCPS